MLEVIVTTCARWLRVAEKQWSVLLIDKKLCELEDQIFVGGGIMKNKGYEKAKTIKGI